MKRGEVWWFEHPDRKRRPACVLTRSEAIPALSSLLVVEARSRARGIPTEVRLDESDGMPIPCVLALDAASSVRKALLTEFIAELPERRMLEVCRALQFATGC